mmetsp:Transcript_34396/g.70392  ORF Transcript_34396/g.70392 Transcript_34396/m.70392 type:complete len:96 (-) Transcript_34396:19-306(-)
MSCEDCYKRCCGECSETVGVNGVHECCNCGSMLCNECRVEECKRNPLDCKECVNMISPLLLEENKKLQEELKSMIACLAKIAIKDAAGSALRRWE